MQFGNVKMPSIVAVQFRSRYKPDTFSGGEYTYISDVPLAVGDIVKVPTRFGDSEARVSRVNVPIAEIKCKVGELKHITEAPTIGGLFANAI